LLAPCHFVSTVKATGAPEIADGVCELTNVYENFQWRLCDSHYLPPNTTLTTYFIF
jgi:hypothetical protein